ncbi:MAG TPA: TolC family protein [Thermoanaerobaculia bacterium]|nr:TolC family protein [Thermoanaerobaculia bacterium]
MKTLGLPGFAVAAAVSLSACTTLGPEYKRPEVALPSGYSQPTFAGAVPDAWWTAFGDPALDRLEREALAANQDVAAAAARVEEARALLGIADADRYPEVSVNASASRTRLSQDTSQLPPGIPLELDRFRVGPSVSYEFDFWGRYRRASEAARADLLATAEGQRDVALTLTADVATAWFDLAALDRQLAIARGTRGTRGESVRLQGERYDAGAISELDLAQAQAELASTEATVPALERQIRQEEDRLAVLLGRIGGTIERPAPNLPAPIAPAATPTEPNAPVDSNATSASTGPGNASAPLDSFTLPDVPAGLPSDLLVRRPDLVAAEQRLIAANARIGLARAAYFPDISLTASGGTESRELSNLFGTGTGVWQAALALVQPIFNAHRTRREVEAATARQKQALAAYTKAIQTAFADIEDALAARRTGIAEREALARQVEALERAKKLADLRYEAGESSYLEVLDAERSLFAAQLSLSQARSRELAAGVTLFKALGGGWQVGAGEGAGAGEGKP